MEIPRLQIYEYLEGDGTRVTVRAPSMDDQNSYALAKSLARELLRVVNLLVPNTANLSTQVETFSFSSGRGLDTTDFNFPLISVDKDGVLCSGYDNDVNFDSPLTPVERRELADAMIRIWQMWGNGSF